MVVEQPPVVIGVDGSTGNAGALRYGLAEARRLEVPAHLVHVVPDYVPMTPMLPMPREELTQTGVTTLEKAEADVKRSDPDLEVVGILRRGARADQLAKAAEHAAVLVVGRDDRSLTERLTRRNTSIGVCARSPVPTVVVPADWQPSNRGLVLVAMRSPAHVAELLDDALGLAGDLGGRAVLLHAWGLPAEYDAIVAERYGEQRWEEEITKQLETATTEARGRHPTVDVEMRVVHGPAAHSLVVASEDADVLVLVRRKHGVPAVSRLGGTARSVLRAAHCPVRVVPPR